MTGDVYKIEKGGGVVYVKELYMDDSNCKGCIFYSGIQSNQCMAEEYFEQNSPSIPLTCSMDTRFIKITEEEYDLFKKK